MYCIICGRWFVITVGNMNSPNDDKGDDYDAFRRKPVRVLCRDFNSSNPTVRYRPENVC
jgi:hypothetical protein